MKTASTFATVSLALSLTNSAEGFAPSAKLPQRSKSNGCLNLKPEQGCQLAAAFEATLLSSAVPTVSNPNPNPSTKEHKEHLKAARAFVSRVFSLPASLRHPHPSEILNNPNKEDDVVFFPIVGFQFVNGQPLPTKARACCSIHPTSHDEEVYGWFTPSCPLQELESQEYCSEPTYHF